MSNTFPELYVFIILLLQKSGNISSFTQDTCMKIFVIPLYFLEMPKTE